MTDEKYTFVQDVREKKVTGYSASKRRTHGGKRGRVRLPSDNLTKKELLKMSGECKYYRLNEPMKWEQFKQMPADLQITYIKMLREKYGCPNSALAEMFGVSSRNVSVYTARNLNIGAGKGKNSGKWNKEGFLAWCNGAPIPAKEETPVEEPEMSGEEAVEVLNYLGIAPVIEEEPEEEPAKVVPNYANMGFEGEAEEVLKTVMGILGKTKVRITIGWTVLEDK